MIAEEYISKLEPHELCMIMPDMPEDQFEDLKGDISGSGQLEPIIIWQGKILDGRHRYQACIELGIEPWIKQYEGQDSPADYVISANLRRRHLTESQRALVWAAYCRWHRGGDRKSESFEKIKGSRDPLKEKPLTKSEAAKKAEVSEATMKRAMQVDRKGSPELSKAVRNGEIAVNSAAKLVSDLPNHEHQREALEAIKTKPVKAVVQEIKQRESQKEIEQPQPVSEADSTVELYDHKGNAYPFNAPKGQPKFNKTNDSISWADWTWNPVTGCLHGCNYCYAREIANQDRMKPYYPAGFTPLFHPERLDAPKYTKVPDTVSDRPSAGRVFVCSMADLYGKWVPDEWIEKVHQSMIDNQQWQYMLLTKFPLRLTKLQLPETAWIGTSVDTQARVENAERAFEHMEGKVKVRWLSVEPMLEPLKFNHLDRFDLIVIGAQTATRQPGGEYVPAFSPEFEWVADLVNQARKADCKVWLKPNLLTSPGMRIPQEIPEIGV